LVVETLWFSRAWELYDEGPSGFFRGAYFWIREGEPP
jgi:hypothetical protein